MARWPIDRSWTLFSEVAAPQTVGSEQMSGWRALALHGAAGTGKTYELRLLAETEESTRGKVRFARLATLGQTREGLEAGLRRFAEGIDENTVLYLDALDEVMVPVRTAGLIVQKWLEEHLLKIRPFIRMSCRSAVWPSLLDATIKAIYGKENYAIATLKPLTESDVRKVVTHQNLDAEKFVSEIEKSDAFVLTEQPLTLEMLLRVFQKKGALPAQRKQLFLGGVEALASEDPDRKEGGTSIETSMSDILDVCEQVACYSLLSGKEVIDLSGAYDDGTLTERELAALPPARVKLDFDSLNAMRRCGLCEREGERRFRFAHRQFAEYLAGRRIAKLLPHQARSLLASGLGWQSGVAGPLRETASFAAMESKEIAAWIAECDPEVVGISDVADDDLRRLATRNLIDKFRRHELTDTHVTRDAIELKGFRYKGAEADLAPVLQERADGCEDVLECAIELIDSWALSSMSDELAEVMLDATVPEHPRKSAGYALAKFGTAKARRGLLPLIHADDSDLKGLALRCNWPDAISVPDLLKFLVDRPQQGYHGAYDGFLYELNRTKFDAKGYRREGLQWAQRFILGADYDPTTKIAKRIATAALEELDDPGIVDGIAQLLLIAAKAHGASPFSSMEVDDEQGQATKFKPTQTMRHVLLRAIAKAEIEDKNLWWMNHAAPQFFAIEDFAWLLSLAADDAIPLAERECYAEMAKMLPWQESPECFDEWYRVRECEAVASKFAISLVTVLASEEAKAARKHFLQMKKWKKQKSAKKSAIVPSKRVLEALALCENKDVRYFYGLSQELTLTPESEFYGHNRFVTTTPGWEEASAETRGRIVAAAQKLLLTETEEIELAKTAPFTTTWPGLITALWLALEQAPDWVDSLPNDWWSRRAWYILRELTPFMAGEELEPKRQLLEKLLAKASSEVRSHIDNLSCGNSETKHLFTSLLSLWDEIPDAELDKALCSRLERREIPDDRVDHVAEFILGRNCDIAVAACVARLETTAQGEAATSTVAAAVALLHKAAVEGWQHIEALFRRSPSLVGPVLAQFAHGERYIARAKDKSLGILDLHPKHVGKLATLLLQTFPLESDPDYAGKVHSVTPDDSARHLRGQLIVWLGDQSTFAAVETLRELEKTFGSKYPWLRRPRSNAERSYRLARWAPLVAKDVAQVLSASGKRLIRNGQDAVEGVVAAIEKYERSLHHESPNGLEDLWNRPATRKGRWTPKPEERVSDKLSIAIRDYFRDYAVLAGRELQIAPRLISDSQGGTEGSEVDVLCLIPSAGTVDEEKIEIPIEVKRSHNREAKTGLHDQLVNRYMRELGASFGCFVVAWMGTDTQAGYRALWRTREDAQKELEQIASDEMRNANQAIGVRCIVLNAALPRKQSTVFKAATRKARSSSKRKPAKGRSAARAHSARSAARRRKRPK